MPRFSVILSLNLEPLLYRANKGRGLQRPWRHHESENLQLKVLLTIPPKMDPRSSINEYLMNSFYLLIDPLVIVALLASALASHLLDKMPYKTIIGAHLTIFLFVSTGTHLPLNLAFNTLAITFAIFSVLKPVAWFYAWIGGTEEGFGPRCLTLSILLLLSISIWTKSEMEKDVLSEKVAGKSEAYDSSRRF